MKFGKLQDLSEVDFSLPKDHFCIRADIELREKEEPFRLYVGAPSWANKSWLGKVYPKKTPQREYLKRYAGQFNSIELNSVFYGTPKPEQIQKWRSMTPAHFRFVPKLSRYISHVRKLKDCEVSFQNFLHAMAPFEDRLGPFFMTMPETYGLEGLEDLNAFLGAVIQQWPLAIELRSEEWFSEAQLPKTRALYEKYQLVPLLTDVSGRRDLLHMCISNPVVIIRFVGNELHATDYSRIDEWAERLAEWKQSGLREVYFFLHQPEEELVPELTNYLIEKVNLACGSNFPSVRLLDKEPEQGTLF